MLEYITYFVVLIYSAISIFFDVSFFAEVNETLMIIAWRVGFVLFIPTVILIIVLAVIASSDKRRFVISKPGLCDALIISSWILIGVFLFCSFNAPIHFSAYFYEPRVASKCVLRKLPGLRNQRVAIFFKDVANRACVTAM